MTTPNIQDGETYVHGKTRETALRLLAAAEALELEPSVVRTTQGGFIVPTEVDEWTETPAKTSTKAAAKVEEETIEQKFGEAAEAAVPKSDAPDDSWTHAELDAYADEQGIHLNAGLNKADKIAALTAEKESD